jgi:hypothetical protein
MDEAWERPRATKPEPRVFWGFIDDERHKVVHLYDVGARVNITITPGGGGSGSSPTTSDFTMRAGPFEGRDPRELCGDAIAFWRGYLDEIDQRAAT